MSSVPEMPVSDPNADLETAEDWNREFENLELSGNWARDLVLVAATQQGRGESPNNFEAVLNDAGDAWVRHGYTRYGAWYGYPYAELVRLSVRGVGRDVCLLLPALCRHPGRERPQ